MTVTFLGISHGAWLEADIRKRAAKLDASCRDIISCQVVVDLPHRHHEKGNPFSLRITVTARDEEIAVKRDGLRKELRQAPAVGSFPCASRIVRMPDVNSRRI